MANLGGWAQALGALGNAVGAGMGGAVQGEIMGEELKARQAQQKLLQEKAEAERSMLPIKRRFMEAEAAQMERPKPVSGQHDMIQFDPTTGQYRRVYTATPTPKDPSDPYKVLESRLIQQTNTGDVEGAKGTRALMESIKTVGQKPTREQHTRDALASAAVDPSLSPEERARAKAMLGEIEASHKRTSAAEMAAQLDPQGIEMEAQNVAAGGQMSSLGMGNMGTRNKILNRAAEILASRGQGGGLAETRLQYGAAKSELNKIASQKGPIEAFIRTTDMNLTAAEKLSEQVMRTNIPIYNRGELAVRQNVMGDPLVAVFHSATKTAVDEYARVILSATGNGQIAASERTKVENMLSTANTPAQFKAVAQFMREEMKRRHEGFQQQTQSIYQGRPGGAQERPQGPGMSLPQSSHMENGQIVSDSGKYVWTGTQWRPR